jgi:putative membrane protein
VLALISGLWLWLGVGIGGGPGGAWLHAKLTLVFGLVVYNLYCRKLLCDFISGIETRSHVWFRWFNEVPVIVLLLVTFLVVLKPF